MNDNPKIKLYSFVLDCKDPKELAEFYAQMLNWQTLPIDEDYIILFPKGIQQGQYPFITFQKNPDYVPPVWPAKPGIQQTMAHLDFAVDDLNGAIKYAVELGAKVAEKQFSDDWKVMLDPAGHPFCLVPARPIMESKDFTLL